MIAHAHCCTSFSFSLSRSLVLCLSHSFCVAFAEQGGDCLNVGCVPSKALLACAKRVRLVQSSAAFGIHIDGGVRVDFAAIMERMRRIRAEISWNDGAPRYATQFGVDVFFGAAKFVSGDEVQVDSGASLRFSRAVICTGARGERRIAGE